MFGVEVSTFDRARRRRVYRRLAARLGLLDRVDELLALEDATALLRPCGQAYIGVRTIAVRAIVGTVDRAGDFDGEFLPRRADMADRWYRVERVVRQGNAPPISVCELDGRYFVIDGHHRVAITRQRGIDHVEAEITRLLARAA
jgi:ParB-like nuclease domain